MDGGVAGEQVSEWVGGGSTEEEEEVRYVDRMPSGNDFSKQIYIMILDINGISILLPSGVFSPYLSLEDT